MGVFGEEQQFCPCCKECEEFHKLVELKDSGLVIYYHGARTELRRRQGEVVESAANASRNVHVFILQNTKDVKITTTDLTAKLEKESISCSRCRKIFEHAQELMQNVTSIDSKNVMGICDHCHKKTQAIKKPCCACDEIVKKFILVKDKQKENIKKYVKIWLSKISNLLKDATTLDKPKQIKTHAYSDLQINLNTPASRSKHEPAVQEMFHLETKSDTKLYTEMSETGLKEINKTNTDKPKEDKSEKDGEIILESTISKESQVAKNVLKLEPGQREKNEVLQQVTKDLKSKSEQRGERHTVLHTTKKETMSKPEKRDKDGVSNKDHEKTENGKKGLKRKLESKVKNEISKIGIKGQEKTEQRKRGKLESKNKDDEATEKSKKGVRGRPESKDKDEVSEKGNKSIKSKLEQKDKSAEKGKKLKTEKEIEKQEHDEKRQREEKDKERLKEVDQLRKEKETENKEAAKEKQELSKRKIVSSQEQKHKKGVTANKNRDSSDEIKVSISKIQQSTKQETIKEKERKEKESKGKTSKEESSKVKKLQTDSQDAFKKLQAEYLKEKEEAIEKRKQQEYEAQKAKVLADKKSKEEAERKAQSAEKLKIENNETGTGLSDDLTLKLVRIKQSAMKMSPCDINPELLKAHKQHHQSGQKSTLCPLCLNSELEIEVLSYEKQKGDKISDIIIGEKIFKHYKPHHEKTKESEVVPLLFQSEFFVSNLLPKEVEQIYPQETEPVQKKQILGTVLSKKHAKGVDTEPSKGIIRYALSDRTFIEKGWTMLPTEKVVRKMNVYRMRPAHPEFDWFEHNKNKRLMNYDTGEKLAEFDDNGRGRWYYKSGRLALDYYDAEESKAQQRFVIYSSGEPDERGRTYPITILATFDYLGNGIVFDHAGKIRLKYNQTEGVMLDRRIGPVSHWKWHTLNEPPVLQQVMIDTQMVHKDPNIIKLQTPADTKTRPDNEEMLAIEFDNFIKEKSKKLSQKFKPFQIKMKALKINEHFSLRVLDQATIYLIFRDGSTNLKLNIGMILDHQEIVDTDTAEVGEVSNSLERFPARTSSLADLQRTVAYAQRYERQRTERERRLRRPEPSASADHLTAAASPPLRPPLRTIATGSTSSAVYCSCRKPPNNLYYNTRLL